MISREFICQEYDVDDNVFIIVAGGNWIHGNITLIDAEVITIFNSAKNTRISIAYDAILGIGGENYD